MTTYIDVLITAPISEDDAKRVAKEVTQAAIAAGIDPDAIVVDVSQTT